MPELNLNFTDWNPDASNLNVQGIKEASNIFPSSSGYKSTLNTIPAFTSLPEGSVVVCAYSAEFSNKSKTNFTVSKKANGKYTIDIIGATTVTDATNDDEDLVQVSENNKPRFSQFGDTVLLTHEGEILQFTLGNSYFTPIADSPNAKYITVSENFVIVANTSESGVDNPVKVRWCGLNDVEQWDGSVVGSQAGEQILNYGLGEIKNIVGSSQSVIILLEYGIVRMTYVGGDLIWTFEQIETEIGCLAPDSVINVGSATYFLSYEGYIKLEHYGGFSRVGQNKVDQYIHLNLDTSLLHEVTTIYNRNEDLIWIIIPTTGGKDILFYNIALDKWGRSSTSCNSIAIFKPIAENLDTINKSIDDPTLPNLDSPQWLSGSQDLVTGFCENDIVTFSGSGSNTSLTTHQVKFESNVMITGVEIIGDTYVNANVEVQWSSSVNNPGKSKTSGLNKHDRATLRARGKYFSFNVQTDGGFDATGLKILYKPAGNR